MAKRKIKVEGAEIQLVLKSDSEYVSLTDMARKFNSVPNDLIKAWMRNPATIDFLALWEQLNNPDFKTVGYDRFRMQAGANTFMLSTKKWIKETSAIGLHAQAGRYGGTFAHQDIAVQFATYLSPSFYLYIIREFQRLKEAEFNQKNLEWHIQRITDNIDDVRNLLDTIPGQAEVRKRIK